MSSFFVLTNIIAMIRKSALYYTILCSAFFPLTSFAVHDQTLTMLTFTIDNNEKDHLTVSDIAQLTNIQSFLAHDPDYKTEIERDHSCINHTLSPCLLTSTIREQYTTRNHTQSSPDTTKIRTFIEDIARKANTDPINAKLKFNSETQTIEEIEPGVDGITINVEDNIKKIVELIDSHAINSPQTIELTYTKTPAKITGANAHQLGIIELIGEGRSNFRGSTQSRIHNIQTAAKRFDGIVIPPNEEFSFVSILGPVDGEHGYKEELVIRDNETKPEFGGGICQVSTTVFRGAIYTGMKITQRRNHSYPVQYYTPTGFDATVYVPSPDFRFINNTPGHILLNLEFNGTEIIFKYYGTKDGRTIDMQGPFVTDRQPDGSMKTYFTQKVTASNGDVIIDDVFKSIYKSPNDYPHPGDVAKLTEKPDNWSKKQWDDYKAQNGL